MTEARERLLGILAGLISEETGLAPSAARDAAVSALASDSVDEEAPIRLFDAAGREIGRIPFSLLEEAYDRLDEEEDA